MDNRWKNSLYSLILVSAVALVWWWRQPSNINMMKIEGETMATTYHITYFDAEQRNFKKDVDSLLILVNQSINNYNTTSEVTRFNKSNSGFRFELPYLLPPIKVAEQVFSQSQGAFDPTVMPLVNLWGFGSQKITRPDSAKIDSIKRFIGFEKIKYNSDSVWKLDTRAQLDFGGIGQGYGADVITDFLKSQGIKNMLVELGGEGMACGINLQSGKPWELGILDPNATPEQQFFKAFISLSDKSFTTSGNYFNYREIDGKKYSHTIDPVTGFPATRALLSASIFTENATTADAWGTAMMVLGHEKAIELCKNHPELGVFLIYSTPDGIATFATDNIKQYLTINPSSGLQ
ncbi:MAG: FAD:protein FMN transferase [Flammeovirgaceae bacterium]|nr:FAD:protein FMN transferase [Flammeovirgaceae bacterium]